MYTLWTPLLYRKKWGLQGYTYFSGEILIVFLHCQLKNSLYIARASFRYGGIETIQQFPDSAIGHSVINHSFFTFAENRLQNIVIVFHDKITIFYQMYMYKSWFGNWMILKTKINNVNVSLLRVIP